MDIGMIVYSYTGNTLSVAEKLKEKLSAAGHVVTLERLETVGPATLRNEDAALKTKPPIAPYDALVLGCPVRGGAPPPPMLTFLEQVETLRGKKVALLVTGFFPVAGWGRNQTIAKLKESCRSEGATVCGAESVGWFSLNRKRAISRVVDILSEVF
ncbi:MAG: flavodoxin domain-containing protein [Anaerolineae bacterium]